MSSRSAVLIGHQEPRYLLAPALWSPAGQEAVELAASAGLHLDKWQTLPLYGGLAEAPDGRWECSEVGLIVPRQNGKGGILEARELAGLFLFDEQLILHSAHEFKTAAEAFRRLLFLIQNTPDLDRRVSRVRTSHGDEGIELIGGQRIRFVARSTGSGRGFSGDCIVLDEAYNLSNANMSALLPTLSARPNTQIWYTSSAPLPRQESDTLRRLCKRGRDGARGGDGSVSLNPMSPRSVRLAYFEWSAGDDVDHDDPEAWAQANPAAGIRITPDAIRTELGALEAEDFARERLGIFPEDIEATDPIIDEADWAACTSPKSTAGEPLVLAFEVSTDRKWAVIAAAGPSSAGGTHVEVIENHRRTGWVVPRLIELRDAHKPAAIICNPAGPAGGLLPECEKAGLAVGITDPATGKLRALSGRDYVQACAAAYDAITEYQWRHIDQPELNMAATGAAKRPLGDAWVFDRRGGIDISPLLAVTLAAWAVGRRTEDEPKYEPFVVIT